jgi:hypothetical protein
MPMPLPLPLLTENNKKTKKEKASKREEDDDDLGGDDEDTKTEKEDAAGAAEAAQLKSEVDPILRSGACVKALGVALKEPPKTRELQAMQTELALAAMESIKADEIGKFVDAADDAMLDALMRVTYAGMAKGKNCPNLLIWHSKVSDKAGVGVIMRAMCPKNGF